MFNHVLLLPLLAAALFAQTRYGVGRAPTPDETKAWDISVLPDGKGLPPRSGTVPQRLRVRHAPRRRNETREEIIARVLFCIPLPQVWRRTAHDLPHFDRHVQRRAARAGSRRRPRGHLPGAFGTLHVDNPIADEE